LAHLSVKTLADMQLAILIRKGKYEETCKAEWRRRWALEYPYYRRANGEVVKYE
jgi:hypothetical protein